MPQFTVVDMGQNCYTVNDNGRTVAIITSQGYIDWLLPSTKTPGPIIHKVLKETHLSYTLGLKLMLTPPHPGTEMRKFTYAIEDEGAKLVLYGYSESADGNYAAETTAVMTQDPDSDRYEWALDTAISCTAKAPVRLHGIEFNNVYPSKVGRCMLFAPQKEYDATLMTDKDGVIWRFPHQHMLHYGRKLAEKEFAAGTVAGFFGVPNSKGCPVVVVQESPLPPTWGICDMYYDLHCCAVVDTQAKAGDRWQFKYLVKYLDDAEADRLYTASRPVQITLDDWTVHDYPRFDLGLNTFARCCDIDKPDDCSGFRPRPPQKVWDREVGHAEKGALRITNAKPEETVWGAEPPTQIPAQTRLNITGLVKTEGVEGKGISIRVRYHTFVWHPTPHIEWTATMESEPVNGTTDGWVQIRVPELKVPEEHLDYLVWIEMVLDGKGTAWLTDVDVDLAYETPEPPSIEEGGAKTKQQFRVRSRSRSGSNQL